MKWNLIVEPDKIEVFVCINVDCKSRGANAVLNGLHDRLGDMEARGEVEVRPYVCFSACNSGPNMVIPTKRCWYSGVTPEDLDDVVAYIKGGDDIPRLKQQNDPDLEELIFGIIDAGLIPDTD